MIRETAIDGLSEGRTVSQNDAFEKMWQAHRQGVWRLVARLAGSVDAADDLTQEVFVRAFQAYGGVIPPLENP